MNTLNRSHYRAKVFGDVILLWPQSKCLVICLLRYKAYVQFQAVMSVSFLQLHSSCPTPSMPFCQVTRSFLSVQCLYYILLFSTGWRRINPLHCLMPFLTLTPLAYLSIHLHTGRGGDALPPGHFLHSVPGKPRKSNAVNASLAAEYI